MDSIVERSIDLDVGPDDLWRAITDPDELAAWFAPEVELDVVPGGHGRFVDDDGVARSAVIDDVEPGRRLVLRWWPDAEGPAQASVVTLLVAPRTGGARLVVTEQLAVPVGRMGAEAELSAVADAARSAWMWRLDLLLLRVAAAAGAVALV
jgi:uncharacterized protein YndB with AHSA1/START domain